MVLSVITVWVINYMTQRQVPLQNKEGGEIVLNAQVQVGQSVSVPTREALFAPLNFSTVAPAQEKSESQLIPVSTKKAELVFSSHGAVLSQVSYREHKGKIGPLFSVNNYNQEGYVRYADGLFLLGFEQSTPRNYQLTSKQEHATHTDITFVAQHQGWEVVKTYTIYHDTYKIDLTIDCQRTERAVGDLQPRLFLTAPEVPELKGDQLSFLMLHEVQQTIEKKELNALADKAWFWTTSRPIVGFENKYFVHSLCADQSFFTKRVYAQAYSDRSAVAVLEGARIEKNSSWTLSFYLGPKTIQALGAVDERLEELLAFGWFSWFCRWLLILLAMLFNFVGNYGFAIILLSILLKLPFLPLSVYAKNRSEEYQKYQPTMNRIRAKYKDDLAKQQAELIKFCADHNISLSTPALGCLPLLLQVPIMISLYRILSGHIDLYQAPFIGWITDLSSQDPYYVMPILMGLLMAWQQSMVPMQDEKQRFLMMLMPLVMTGVFSGFPAGLVLYWLMNNNILALIEDYIRKLFFFGRDKNTTRRMS